MQTIIVEKDFDDCRIDRFIKHKFNLTQGLICKLLRQKDILLNGKKAEINNRVKFGDSIKTIATLKIIADKIETKIIKSSDVDLIKKSIIFENDEIIAIDKPYGISVQEGEIKKISVIEVLQNIYDENIKIVHRLDKETTGVMIFAKNRISAIKFTELFKSRLIKKTYIAKLDGIPKILSGSIETNIDKISGESSESFAQNVNQGGKVAISEYNIIEINKENNSCIAEFKPETGRMHQIRLHALHMNCPIIGDKKYNKHYSNGEKMNLRSISIKLSDELTINVPRGTF